MNLKSTPILKSSLIKVGITIGDPSGVGPAIAIKAINKLKGLADFTIIGDGFVLDKVSKTKIRSSTVRILDLENVSRANFRFGKLSAEYGKASIEYLDKAMELLAKKELDCLVTCPISKEAINLAGYKISGHTEYLSKKCHSADIVMMLLNDQLKFSLITRHIPLKDVSTKLSSLMIKQNITLTTWGLRKLFLIKHPRIVVCGLNPHASDNGIIGNQELKVITPAINGLKKRLKAASIKGPVSADVAIAKAYKGEFDCVVAMYHDQALIPLKLTGFESGVNLTLGLGFVRTSPLHGTAFDIASNNNLINPQSVIRAISLAIKCTQNLRRA